MLCHDRCAADVSMDCGLSEDLLATAIAAVDLMHHHHHHNNNHNQQNDKDIHSPMSVCSSKSTPLMVRIDENEWSADTLLDDYLSPLRHSQRTDSPRSHSDDDDGFARHDYQPLTSTSSNTTMACRVCDDEIQNDHGLKCRRCHSAIHRACQDRAPYCVKSSDSLMDTSPANNSSSSLRNVQGRRTSNAYGTETLLRLKRNYNNNQYDSASSSDGIFKPDPKMFEPITNKKKRSSLRNVFTAPSPITPTSPDADSPADDTADVSMEVEGMKRKIHHFRGHEFLATYLDLPAPSLQHKCQLCREHLGDGGRQCYQCRFCDYYCHKKCYIKTKPCSVRIGSLEGPSEVSGGSSDPEDKRSMLVYRNSIRSLPRQSKVFIEDFSDELVPASHAHHTTKQTTATRAEGGDRLKQEEENALMDYCIDDGILGSGQYGVVRKGHYKHDPSAQIAIKLIDKKRLWDPHKKRQLAMANRQLNGGGANGNMPTLLRRELDILKKLDHPGIIRMHHFVDLPTQTYVIMDLAPDGDLLDYVMKIQRVPESEVKEIARQVLLALKYLHDRNICHRDLKPENLLLIHERDERTGEVTGRKVVKIADFGFATVFGLGGAGGAMRMLQSVVGTPAYMAPEIVDPRVWQYASASDPVPTSTTSSSPAFANSSASKGYDKSADLWSLGVILYVCLGGVFPFDSTQPILDQILRGEFYFPDEFFGQVSDEAVDLVCNLLVVNPKRRFRCDECLRHVWLRDEQEQGQNGHGRNGTGGSSGDGERYQYKKGNDGDQVMSDQSQNEEEGEFNSMSVGVGAE